MAIQFNTDAPAESIVSPEVEMLEDMRELGEVKAEIESLIGELPEMDAIYDNLTASMRCLTDAKNKDEAVLALNIDHSIEDLLGVAEDKITAKAAVEGLGDKLKSWWNKFVEWVKRVCRNIANFFRKLFGFAPKVSKEAQELADLTGADPEEVQKGLDKMNDTMEAMCKGLSASIDNSEFDKAFQAGLQMSQKAFGQLDSLSKLNQSNHDQLDNLVKETEKVMAELCDPNSDLSKQLEAAGKAMWGDDFSYIKDSTESVAIACTVAAMQQNLKAVAKDTGTVIPKMSKQLADSTDKCEKVISDSQLARMSAKEIEEFYASGGKVEDPALFKAAVAAYKALSKGVTIIHAKLGKLLNARMKNEKKFVDTCKSVVNKAAA